MIPSDCHVGLSRMRRIDEYFTMQKLLIPFNALLSGKLSLRSISTSFMNFCPLGTQRWVTNSFRNWKPIIIKLTNHKWLERSYTNCLPFRPMRALRLQWSWAFNLVCEVELSVILEWQKPFQMVSQKNHNLNVNEDFEMFLTSKLITCLLMVSLPEWNPNQLFIY